VQVLRQTIYCKSRQQSFLLDQSQHYLDFLASKKQSRCVFLFVKKIGQILETDQSRTTKTTTTLETRHHKSILHFQESGEQHIVMQDVERWYRGIEWTILPRVLNHKPERFVWISVQTSFNWLVNERTLSTASDDSVHKGVHRNQNQCGYKDWVTPHQSNHRWPELQLATVVAPIPHHPR